MSYKPYCKVCHDAGKPEREYTSHWVKDRSGKTLCPTLLSTECRYCFKLGHTAKFCDLLVKKNKAKDLKTVSQKRVKPNHSPLKPVNSFAVLEIESGSEEEEIAPQISLAKVAAEEYPALSNKEPVRNEEPKTNWASIAAKPAVLRETVPHSSDKSSQLVPVSAPSREWLTKSWADWTDSDSDEEEVVKPWNIVSASQTMPAGWSKPSGSPFTAVAEDDDW